MGIVRHHKYDLDQHDQHQDHHQHQQTTSQAGAVRSSRGGMSCTNFLFVSGSLTLTAAVILVGISFFSPYWLSNIAAVADDERNYTDPQRRSYLTAGVNVTQYPDRGLWAQCGAECQWFWENDYMLQKRLLTPLKWHLATQVLYVTAAVLLLIAEIFARAQLCCDERKLVYWALASAVLASGLIQLGAVATFGGGASRPPYNAISNPSDTTPLLGHPYDPDSGVTVYLGWSFWVAVVGDMLTVVSGTLFVITAVCVHRKL